jgi:diguanylate cyclase (GGDEF)-like protein/PAS domain S-box-containing protein
MDISEKITKLNQTTLDSLDEPEKLMIIGRFAETGTAILGGDFGFAYWKEDSNETFKLVYKSPNITFEPRLPRSDGFTSIVEKTKTPYLALVQKEENPEYDLSQHMKSIAIIPVFYKEYQYGDIVICFKEEKQFLEEDRSLSAALGNAAAQAITIHRLILKEQEARMYSEGQKLRFRAMIEHSYDVIALLDKNGRIVDISNSAKNVTGYEIKDLMGKNYFEFIHPDDSGKILEHMRITLEDTLGSHITEVRYRHADGSWRWMEASGANMINDLNVGGIVVNIRDITDRKQDEQTIKMQATHDSLTELPNREEFRSRFAQALEQTKRNNGQLALMFLDMDRFKNVNDRLGHREGDMLLKVVASRLSACLRSEDIAARFGGDEFLILINEIHSSRDVVVAAEKVLRAVNLPVNIGEHIIYPSVSIGVSIYPSDALDFEGLKKNADVALYRAKENGRNRFSLYDSSLNTVHQAERFTQENELREALVNNQITVFYQPIINLKKQKLVAVEALARWQHPTRGLLLPSEFIPLAEEAGFISELDKIVLRQVCVQAKTWQNMGLPNFRIAVNLSAQQFSEPEFVSGVAGVLTETGLDGNCLEVEITESLAMGNLELTSQNLKALKKLGVHITIDDFGTGYSSLNYLKSFPIQGLKIDKSFIRHCITHPSDTSITKAIIAMAQALNLKVVAEGVEEQQQLDFLTSLGCDGAQGFLIAKPMTPEDLPAWYMINYPQEKFTPIHTQHEAVKVL